MPSYSSKLQLSSTARSGNIILADIDKIKGAFKVYTSTALNSESVNYFADGQIVYVEDSGSLYKANVSPANPPTTFVDSVIFTAFSFNSGSFVSASFNGSTNALTLFGEVVEGSIRVSSSIDLSSLSGGGGGSGDITAVFTSDEGIKGGTSSGNVVLELDPGDGISLSTRGININTGSAHFTEAVQKINLDGGLI
jgi:hypothetical protein|tara:strand:+ start:10797 stop:11381 length:585 start_codon:yes stop_codon:yes gene_type:complete